MRFRAKVIAEAIYEAEPENYGTSVPEDMIKIDLQVFEADIIQLIELCDLENMKITVERIPDA